MPSWIIVPEGALDSKGKVIPPGMLGPYSSYRANKKQEELLDEGLDAEVFQTTSSNQTKATNEIKKQKIDSGPYTEGSRRMRHPKEEVEA